MHDEKVGACRSRWSLVRSWSPTRRSSSTRRSRASSCNSASPSARSSPSFISVISPIDAHAQLEVGLVGNEGMLGVSLVLAVRTPPLRALVQGGGRARRLGAATFRRALAQSPRLRSCLDRNVYVLLSQLPRLRRARRAAQRLLGRERGRGGPAVRPRLASGRRRMRTRRKFRSTRTLPTWAYGPGWTCGRGWLLFASARRGSYVRCRT